MYALGIPPDHLPDRGRPRTSVGAHPHVLEGDAVPALAADDVDGTGGVDHRSVVSSASPRRASRAARPRRTCGQTRATPKADGTEPQPRTRSRPAPPAELFIPHVAAVPPQRPHNRRSVHTHAHTHVHKHTRARGCFAEGTAKPHKVPRTHTMRARSHNDTLTKPAHAPPLKLQHTCSRADAPTLRSVRTRKKTGHETRTHTHMHLHAPMHTHAREHAHRSHVLK